MSANLPYITASTVAISTALVTIIGNIKKIVPSRRKTDTTEEE